MKRKPHSDSERDPRHHTENIRRMLATIIDQARKGAQKIDEPKAQALLETTAEVLIGLRTACEHYESKIEPAMA